MKHDGRFAIRITADLPGQTVAISDLDHADIERFQLREEAHREEPSRFPKVSGPGVRYPQPRIATGIPSTPYADSEMRGQLISSEPGWRPSRPYAATSSGGCRGFRRMPGRVSGGPSRRHHRDGDGGDQVAAWNLQVSTTAPGESWLPAVTIAIRRLGFGLS